jgi:hypothetical protein
MPEIVRNARYTLIHRSPEGALTNAGTVDARNDSEAQTLAAQMITEKQLSGQLLLVRNVAGFEYGDPSPSRIFV